MSELITALTEDTYKEFLKEGRVVIRTWDEGCGYCTKYEPIFNEYIAETQVKAGTLRLFLLKEKKPSEFKRAFMKQDKQGNTSETVPGTFVFENGELKARHFGAMTKAQLHDLVTNFKTPVDTTLLKARAFDLNRIIELSRTELQQVLQQIEKGELYV